MNVARLRDLEKEIIRIFGDDPACEIALKILHALQNVPLRNASRLTLSYFCKITNADKIDNDLMRVLAILSGSNLHILNSRFVYYDEYDKPYDISPEEFAEATRDGFLINKDTGEPDETFSARTYPYFQLSAFISNNEVL